MVWTDGAVANVEAIVTYIAGAEPAAADRMMERLVAVADSLAIFPHRGREVGGDRREMTTVWPYVLRYRVMDDAVVILRVRHGARDEEVAAFASDG